jgi:membrane dipeptidase
MVSRRSFLAGGASVFGAPFINRGRFRLFAGDASAAAAESSAAEYSTQTIDLVRESLVIDMLGLLTLDYQKLASWRAKPSGFKPAELQRLKNSGITIFHPAVGYTAGNIYEESLKDITGWNIFIAGHADEFLRVDNVADLPAAKKLGKIGIIIGQQNSEHFRTVDDVDRFYAMGQRVSQLTYNPNRIGGGSTDPRDGGLTGYGVQIVQRMNALGMAVDISHCADKTTLGAIEASRKPVLITHSNCRALMKTSARCKPDEAIRKMAAKGGVMGITMVRFFIGAADMVTIENMLDHIDHVAKLVGVEHVGVGTDVDLDGRDHGNPAAGGLSARKNDLDGVAYQKKIFDLAEGLFRRNYSRENIRQILGGNFQRALNDIWLRPA